MYSSLADIESTAPACADLLRLCAFLHADAIPLTIIAGAHNLGPRLALIKGNTLSLMKKITALHSQRLINYNQEMQTLSLRVEVQEAVRAAISAEERKQWMQRTISAVNTTFPEIVFAQWEACERYLPHALTCARWIEQENLLFVDAAHLLNKAGYYLFERGRYDEAEPLYKRALFMREQLLETEHPDMAQSINNLAGLYFVQKKYAEVEPLYLRALSMRERYLGARHVDTATSLNNLAALFYQQGKYAEAEPLYLRALSIQEERLGAGHPKMALTLSNLAGLYAIQEKYTEAEPLYRRALSMREEQLGADHPLTQATRSNYAALLHKRRTNIVSP